MKGQPLCLLLSLVLAIDAAYVRPLVGPKERIEQLFREVSEDSWYGHFKSLEQDYMAWRRVDGEVEAAIGFAYLERANELTITMSPKLFDALEELLTTISPSDERLREAFARYRGRRYWDWNQGHFVRLSELEHEWNEESGNDLTLAFIQSIAKAVNDPWLFPELFEETLRVAQNRCSGHMQDQNLERKIAILSSMFQVTITVLESDGKEATSRWFKFDPLIGSSVMTIHLLVFEKDFHPIFHILTPREHRHYGQLSKGKCSIDTDSLELGTDVSERGKLKISGSEKRRKTRLSCNKILQRSGSKKSSNTERS